MPRPHAPKRTGDRGPRCRWRRPISLLLVAWLAAFPELASAQSSPVDTTGLGTGPHARMHMLFEKTIFQVDVLTLDVRLGRAETARLDSLVTGREYSRALADSAAAVALGARDAGAHIVFKRDVSLDQFLDGILDNLGHAREAGIVSRADYETIAAGLPRWYAFLRERGIRDGDQMLQRVRGDTLHTVFRGVDGTVLLDQVDVGPERRLSVLGGYFAPESDFRKGLIRSLFERPS